MITVIGGSPGSGTSLLVNILNRHSEIVAGPETSLFSRPQLIVHWSRYKALLYGKRIRKLRNPGWHRYYGTDLLHQFYGLNYSELRDVVLRSSDFTTFCTSLNRLITSRKKKSLWYEKTPGNTASFYHLGKHPEVFRTILITRNPYDTIASLYERGFSIPYATALYLLNISAGLSGANKKTTTIRYEDLVLKPQDTLKNLCQWSVIAYQPEILYSGEGSMQMKGWLNAEDGPVSESSIDRFQRLNTEVQDHIRISIERMKINLSFDLYGIPFRYCSIIELCDDTGYPAERAVKMKTVPRFMKNDLIQEKMLRSLTGYRTHMFNFPVLYDSI